MRNEEGSSEDREKVTIRLNKSEKESLKTAASARNMSLNAYIKSRICDVTDDVGEETPLDASVKFHWTCYGAGMMHAVFLLNFLRLDMGMLVALNCFSVMIYFALGLVTGRTGIAKHALAWTIVIYAEILIHALFCTVVQGLDVEFYIYPLLGVPLYAYYLFIYCNRRTFLRTLVVMGVITLIALPAAIFFVEFVGSVYELTGMHVLTSEEILSIRGINIVFAFCMALLFTLIFCMEVMRLLGQLQNKNRRLNYIASHDPLTGLGNRRSLWHFFDLLKKSGDRYCIIMGDLDDFKKINDTFGHDCGDEVLRAVSAIILELTGKQEMACRWGGEEMLIVMRGSREDCLERLAEIRQRICALNIFHDRIRVKVTMTFGFADCEEELPADAATENSVRSTVRSPSDLAVDSLISMVDQRLYVGKRSGKNVIISE